MRQDRSCLENCSERRVELVRSGDYEELIRAAAAYVPPLTVRLSGRWLECSAGSRSQRRVPGSGSAACVPCSCKRDTPWTHLRLVSPEIARNAMDQPGLAANAIVEVVAQAGNVSPRK